MKTQLKLPQDGVISKWNFFEVQNEVDPFQLQLRDWAKVRFECIKCGNGWTSMRGLIRFQIQIQNLFMPDRVKRCFMVITNKKIALGLQHGKYFCTNVWAKMSKVHGRKIRKSNVVSGRSYKGTVKFINFSVTDPQKLQHSMNLFSIPYFRFWRIYTLE